MNFKLSKKYKNKIRFFITIIFMVNFSKSIKALDYSYVGLFNRSTITELDSSFIFIKNGYNNFIFTNKIFTADKIKFSKNEIALIETDGTIVDVKIGDSSYKADIKINNLDTQHNVFKDTAFLMLKNNKNYTATITVSEFEFKNSRIGSLIIDDNITTDGNGINIFAKNSVDISDNTFLNAFIVAAPKGEGSSSPAQNAIKQNVIIYSDNITNITGNSAYSGLKTTKKFTLGKTNTSTTILSRNKTDIAYSGGYFIHGDEGISILGNIIKIENNLIGENNSGGFFESKTGDIEIGDNNTHILIVNDNKTADTNASFAKSNNGNITLKSPTINGRITLDFKDRKSDSVKSISILEGIKEGIEYAFHSPQITTLLAFAGVFSFIALTYPLLMPIYTKEVLHSGADILGWIMSSTGIGALCSSIFLASKTSLRGLKYIICCGATLLSCGFILMGLIHSTAGSCITMFFVGLGFTSAITSDSTLLQSILDDDKRGRIMSLYSICFLGATSISNLVAGSIAQVFGISNTLIIFGAVLLFSTILFFIKFLHLEFKTRI